MMLTTYRQEKQLGWLLACGAAALALWPLLQSRPAAWPWGALSALLLLLTMVAPRALTPLTQAWLLLGHVLGNINTKVILAAMFFLVITPVALLFRLLGRDALKLRPAKAASYWLKQHRSFAPDTFRNQF